MTTRSSSRRRTSRKVLLDWNVEDGEDCRSGELIVLLLCWGVDLDEEPPAPVVRSPSREKMRKEQQAESDWNRSSYQSGGSGYQNVGDRGSRFDRDDRYDSSGSSGGRNTSEWAEAGKDAQAYLRKQTEQAYDFAKKISIEDAKKGASETAKKAKKWVAPCCRRLARRFPALVPMFRRWVHVVIADVSFAG